MISPAPHKIYKTQPQIAKFTFERARLWAPSAVGWAAFAGITVMLLVSEVPLVKQDIMSKIPVVGDYWKVEESK